MPSSPRIILIVTVRVLSQSTWSRNFAHNEQSDSVVASLLKSSRTFSPNITLASLRIVRLVYWSYIRRRIATLVRNILVMWSSCHVGTQWSFIRSLAPVSHPHFSPVSSPYYYRYSFSPTILLYPLLSVTNLTIIRPLSGFDALSDVSVVILQLLWMAAVATDFSDCKWIQKPVLTITLTWMSSSMLLLPQLSPPSATAVALDCSPWQLEDVSSLQERVRRPCKVWSRILFISGATWWMHKRKVLYDSYLLPDTILRWYTRALTIFVECRFASLQPLAFAHQHPPSRILSTASSHLTLTFSSQFGGSFYWHPVSAPHTGWRRRPQTLSRCHIRRAPGNSTVPVHHPRAIESAALLAFIGIRR